MQLESGICTQQPLSPGSIHKKSLSAMQPSHHPRRLLISLMLIVFCILALLFIHHSNQGERIYFDTGMAFKAKDLAIALSMLALVIAPFPLAFYLDAFFHWRTRRLAPVISLCVLLAFPFSFKFVIWHPASYADGRPMYNLHNERERTIYATSGYRPLWRANFRSHSTYDSYAKEKQGIRQVSRGNLLWGEFLTYGLNRQGLMSDKEQSSASLYECLFMRTTHILGFYLLDRRGEELQYMAESSLPGNRCRRIEQPLNQASMP
jgi:hypothetical protein